MDAVNRSKVKSKWYRMWYLLNKDTKIRVRTGVGFSEWADAGEIIGQGTCGGAVISGANLDGGVSQYFDGSDEEVYYGNIRIQPLLYQDDVLRMATSVSSARTGNTKLDVMAKSKQLEMHPDKTCFIVIGKREQILKIEKEIEQSPILFGNFETKKKMNEKWLGDKLSEDGIGKSVEDTVKVRKGRVVAVIFEVKGIIQDYRMQCIGGMMAAIDLFELSIIPALLNNSESWTPKIPLISWKSCKLCSLE